MYTLCIPMVERVLCACNAWTCEQDIHRPGIPNRPLSPGGCSVNDAVHSAGVGAPLQVDELGSSGIAQPTHLSGLSDHCRVRRSPRWLHLGGWHCKNTQ